MVSIDPKATVPPAQAPTTAPASAPASGAQEEQNTPAENVQTEQTNIFAPAPSAYSVVASDIFATYDTNADGKINTDEYSVFKEQTGASELFDNYYKDKTELTQDDYEEILSGFNPEEDLSTDEEGNVVAKVDFSKEGQNTLWGAAGTFYDIDAIAQSAGVHPSVARNEVMKAIAKANPEAMNSQNAETGYKYGMKWSSEPVSIVLPDLADIFPPSEGKSASDVMASYLSHLGVNVDVDQMALENLASIENPDDLVSAISQFVEPDEGKGLSAGDDFANYIAQSALEHKGDEARQYALENGLKVLSTLLEGDKIDKDAYNQNVANVASQLLMAESPMSLEQIESALKDNASVINDPDFMQKLGTAVGEENISSLAEKYSSQKYNEVMNAPDVAITGTERNDIINLYQNDDGTINWQKAIDANLDPSTLKILQGQDSEGFSAALANTYTQRLASGYFAPLNTQEATDEQISEFNTKALYSAFGIDSSALENGELSGQYNDIINHLKEVPEFADIINTANGKPSMADIALAIQQSSALGTETSLLNNLFDIMVAQNPNLPDFENSEWQAKMAQETAEFSDLKPADLFEKLENNEITPEQAMYILDSKHPDGAVNAFRKMSSNMEEKYILQFFELYQNYGISAE